MSVKLPLILNSISVAQHRNILIKCGKASEAVMYATSYPVWIILKGHDVKHTKAHTQTSAHRHTQTHT